MRRYRFIGLCALALLCAPPAFAQSAFAESGTQTRTYALKDAIPGKDGYRRMAVLRGLDKVTGHAIDINAPAGVPVHFGTLAITLRWCHSTPPEEPPETSAFLQIDDQLSDQPVQHKFSGWMFASSPGLNGLEHPVYDLWVKTCKTDEPAPVAEVAVPDDLPAPDTPAPLRDDTPSKE
jgi:hypothetical protein